jgi:zinc protease
VSLETLERAVDQVLASFAAAPQKDADLARARTQLVANVTYRRDSQFAMAQAYGTALMIGLTADDVNEWPGRIRAVTADGVRKAAAGLNRKDAVTAYLRPGK